MKDTLVVKYKSLASRKHTTCLKKEMPIKLRPVAHICNSTGETIRKEFKLTLGYIVILRPALAT